MAKLQIPPGLTEDQADIIIKLTNLDMKVLVTKCVLGAFFIILLFFILQFIVFHSSWQDKTITGCFDLILSGTMYPLVSHYLPSFWNAKKAENKDNN
jgi:hypothetical protein